MLIGFLEEMVKLGKVYDKDPEAADAKVLGSSDSKVRTFLALQKVFFNKLDQSLFDRMYDILGDLQGEKLAEWTKVLDKPDRRMFYRAEDGVPYASLITDLVAECSLGEMIACFDNHTILSEVVPSFFDLKYLNRRGEGNALVYAKQKFPWPF